MPGIPSRSNPVSVQTTNISNNTPDVNAPPTKTLEERRKESASSFLGAAKEVLAKRAEQTAAVQTKLDALPTGIVTNPTDIAQLRTLAKELASVNPVLPGGQNYQDQVFELLRTDFAQTEVPGLAPSGRVFQVLSGGDTRANFSQFTRPDGGVINAVEIGKVKAGLSSAGIEITGLYGFAAVEPALTSRELLDLTKGIKQALVLADRVREAKGDPKAVGPRSAEVVNSFLDAIENKDAAALEARLPATVSPETRADIQSLFGRFTDAERAVLKRVGQVMDLNTPLGPVSGSVGNLGIGYQQFLSKQGDQPGDRVVFQSGSLNGFEGAFGDSVTTPGQRGYQYTFEAKRLAIE